MAHRARLTTDQPRPVALALVRHAETPWVVEDRFQGRADTHLSPLGEAQAAAVGRRLASPGQPPPLPLPDVPPTAIWHSPLERAAATARAIAAAHRDPVVLQPDEGLIELDVGDWEGLTNAEVAARWPAEHAAWRRDPSVGFIPGGEPAPAAVPRVSQAVRTIVAALEGGDPASSPAHEDPTAAIPPARRVGPPEAAAWGVVVSHDGILRVALLDLLGLPLARYWTFPMAAAGITIVDRPAGGPWRLRVHGLTGTLEPAQPLSPDEVPGA